MRYGAAVVAGEFLSMHNGFEKTGCNSIKRFLAAGTVSLACLFLAASGTFGQETEQRPRQIALNTRMLTPAEGRSIVEAAWQAEPPDRGETDCSHLVHKIYENAGFDYPYASSFELYAGHGNFVRVRYPRAGDVIVWPGHVGIVIDPQRHSFYSLVREGVQEQNYESPYWVGRGRPRFLRYRVDNGDVLSADTAAAKSGKQRSARNMETADAASVGEPIRVDTNRPPVVTASQKTAEIYGPPAPQEETPTGETSDTVVAPSSVTVGSGSAPPTREDVAGGIAEIGEALGGVLRTQDLAGMRQPVIIVNSFSVQKVETKRGRGWAQLVVNADVSIGAGKTEIKPRKEKVRWELRRTDSGWEAVAPANRTYVPRDVAVKSLAARLAALSASAKATQHDDGTLHEEAEIAGVLNALLAVK